MAKAAKTAGLTPTRFENGEAVGASAQVHWQPVWCAAHHFITLERRLTACPFGCPPGPAIRMIQSKALETLGGGSRGGMKTETGRGMLLKGNMDLPWEHEFDAKGQPIHIMHGAGLESYCGLCVNNSYVSHPRYRALILRENEKDLADWLSRAHSLYSPMGANVTEKPARIVWPHPFTPGQPGAMFILGHMRDSSAWSDYQGQEFHRMVFEELTQIPDQLLYLKIIGSCRSTFRCRKNCKDGECTCGVLRRQVFNTANPGGPGHSWVKKRFVSVGTANEVYTDPLTKDTRVYIPSLVTDNPYLMQDASYVAWLEGLPEPTRSAWRFGDWDALGGQYFRDFRPKGPLTNEPQEARHVIPNGSRALMPWWPRWIGGDWGYGHGFAVYWACSTPEGQTVVYREMIGNETGSEELGMMIARASFTDLMDSMRDGGDPKLTFWLSPDARGKRDDVKTVAQGLQVGIDGVLGPGAAYFPERWKVQNREDGQWSEDSFGNSRKLSKFGIEIRAAQTNRIAGWQHIREMLRFTQIKPVNPDTYNAEYAARLINEGGGRYEAYMKSFEARKPEVLPRLLIYDSCQGIINAIPTAVYKEGTEDVLKVDTQEDDQLDGLRYCLHSENIARSKEPQRVFVQRHLDKLRQSEPDIDYNGLVWAARFAEEKYSTANPENKPFTVHLESSRAGKKPRVH